MVSLIKNQILKHLSRFTKNLSPDKINLSTFKGEGELSSLELDEIVLTDLLELPSWVRLTSAWCNRVAFRIQWTKLKSVPILISLDEVKVEIETCEELRSLSAQQGLSSYVASKYNFINKVIDGMTITVNVVAITFKSPAFIASVQVMRILVESKTPDWKKDELPKTRLKDSSKEQVLIFKGLEWQTLRLEASSTKDSELPPLRLLTNKARCRLTIKKRISDCFVMGCKLLLLLEDLLWVLTDSQLKAVLHFVESLSGLVEKANEITRIKKAARKLEMLPEYQAQVSQQARHSEPNYREQAFARCDVIETSYHFLAQKIDLHLSDDPGAGRSCHPLLQNGSAVHLQVCFLQIDYYPYHLSAADRTHWGRYNPTNSPHVQWLNSSQNTFKNSLLQLIDASKSQPMNLVDNIKEDERVSPEKNSNISPSSYTVKKYVISNLAKVMTSCIVLRIEDFVMHRVTTINKQAPKEFIKGQHKRRENLPQGDKERHTFPSEVTLHAEFTYYYYPGDIAFPLPPPKFYVQVNPVVVNFDLMTVLWINSFALNLHHSLQNQDAPLTYIDVKIEAIMPRLIFENSMELPCGQKDRPKSLQFQVSRALISNVRSPDCCSRADLAKCINASQLGSLFYEKDFPSKSDDLTVVTNKFIDHAECKDNIQPVVDKLPTGSVAELVNSLTRNLLWTEARDVWCINFEPLWGDFYGARGIAHNRPVAFLDAFPVKIWLHMNTQKNDIHALAYISNLVSLQINHYQLLFLLRLADELTELVTILEMDSDRIKNEKSGSLTVGTVIPQIEVTLVMPSQTPGKESSGADLESVIPDTSSLADDVVTNPSIQWNTVLSTNLQDGGIYRRENTVSATSPPSDQISIDLASPVKLDSPKSNLNTLMKKGLTNISNFLDSALKPVPDDCTSDSVSMRSDGTTDSDDNSVIRLRLSQEGDVMFRVEGAEALSEGVDVGSEVFEEEDHSGATMSLTTASETQSNASSYKRRDLISVATFKLGQVELVQQSVGLDSVIKAHISYVTIDECSAIPWDEFQGKFSTRSRGWTEVSDKNVERPRIRLRKEHSVKMGVGELKAWPGGRNNSWFSDLLLVSLSNLHLSMNLTTVTSIAEFLVDDLPSPPIPLQLNLEDIVLSFADDRTIIHGAVNPINCEITRLRVCRNKDGLILVEPPTNCNPESQELTDLKAENEQLRRRLTAMERLNEENHYLRKCEEEAHLLRSCLAEAQESLTVHLREKQGLLEIVKNFQMTKGENRQQSSTKR